MARTGCLLAVLLQSQSRRRHHVRRVRVWPRRPRSLRVDIGGRLLRKWVVALLAVVGSGGAGHLCVRTSVRGTQR